MIGGGMARRGRRHVAEHEVGRTAERLPDLIGGGGVGEVALQYGRAGGRVGRGQVDAAHGAARSDALDRDLCPAARRTAEIDDAVAGRQQMKTLVELDQLESGARAVAAKLCLGDIGIVELPRQPFGRGRFPAARALDAHGKGTGARTGAAVTPGAARFQAPASPPCIRSNRMPSRMPRSATRRRPTGQVEQIASRMAQPLSTRSARSRPTQGLAARPSISSPARWRETISIWSKVSMLPSTRARTYRGSARLTPASVVTVPELPSICTSRARTLRRMPCSFSNGARAASASATIAR